jgi:CxxC motif-containing protein (DUF1111 family)
VVLLSVTAFAGVPEGRALFLRDWTVGDDEAGGDGLGPLYNATSCAACHASGGVGGAGGADSNVVLLPSGLVPRHGVSAGWSAYRETLLEPSVIPEFGCGTAAHQFFLAFQESERQTPALFGAALLDAVSEEDLAAAVAAGEAAGVSGRIARDAEGRPGRFGWKAQTATLATFVEAACAAELGLSTPTTPQAPDPLAAEPPPAGPDLSAQQVAELVAFVASLPPPARASGAGGARLAAAGCTACHAERLGAVEGAYTDLLLHDLGFALAEPGGGYGASNQALAAATPDEWRTPPLWGLGDSAPYLHDGRAATLDDAVRAHGGEATPSVAAYAALSDAERAELLTWLGGF